MGTVYGVVGKIRFLPGLKVYLKLYVIMQIYDVQDSA